LSTTATHTRKRTGDNDMHMTSGQYMRIETAAGGVGCTEREFIRAARTLLDDQAKNNHQWRQQRHDWLRDGLRKRADSLELFRRVG
jgi:hypothetical protein